MGFEEEIYEIVRRKADLQRRRFIRRHGTAENMTDLAKKIYKMKYENVTRRTINGFNKRMNCGGYALEVDSFILPNGDSLSGFVSSILERYEFIRLLGDMPLQDDEYLVFYRMIDYQKNRGINKGHHFIKVNDDGLVVEKCGDGSPAIFEEWNERYLDSPEVAFAVKKEHEEEIDKDLEKDFNWIRLDKGLDFEESVYRAILLKSNIFEYHGHTFRLKKSTDEVFITDEKGEIVGNAYLEGKNVIVKIKEDKENYVENYSGPVKPVIQNGRLVNFAEFKKQRDEQEMEM